MKMLQRLLPRNWRSSNVPVRYENSDSFGLFDDFNSLLPDIFSGAGAFPSVSASETDSEFVIEAKLPHMRQQDIDVSISDGMLTINAERREEKKKNRKGQYMFRSSFARFYKTIPLPDGIDMDHIEANFKRGVLRLKVPKTAEARERTRRIPISVEA